MVWLGKQEYRWKAKTITYILRWKMLASGISRHLRQFDCKTVVFKNTIGKMTEEAHKPDRGSHVLV